MEKKNFLQKNWLILALVGFAFLSQYLFTVNSLNQIRYEELAESVRNVFWLEYQAIYDGISSNIGWYGILLIIYKIFGFTIFTAKYYRLILQLVALICLALTLKRYFGKNFVIPYLAISLSPTLLYFNVLQASYGIDLQYLIIALFIITYLNFKKLYQAIISQFFLGLVVMAAAMSYPPFIFYCPLLAVYYFWQLFQQKQSIRQVITNILLMSIFIIWPLLLGIAYIADGQQLFYDPVVKSGIFRGAGTFDFQWNNWLMNASGLSADLFRTGNSYNFEYIKGDFSDFYPIISIILIFLTSVWLIYKKNLLRWPTIITIATLLLTLIFANLSIDPSTHPGIRRNTPILAAFYILMAMAWYFWSNRRNITSYLKILILTIILFIPLHHLSVYFINLNDLSKPSLYQYSQFNLAGTPEQTLRVMVKAAQQQSLKLGCQNENKEYVLCRYSEIYAAVAGSCLWNHLDCYPVQGYDLEQNQYLDLKPELWINYYFPH